jgi:septum formation inhibitor MinC
MTHLYHLGLRYQQLLEKDELTAEDCAELENLHADAEDHCIERAKYIRNLEAEQQAVEVAMEEMDLRVKELGHRIIRQREELVEYMKQHQLVKVTKSPLFPIQVVKNRVSVDPYDTSVLPEAYWSTKEKVTVERKPDKDFIRKTIESGVEVPGARLIAKSRLEFK